MAYLLALTGLFSCSKLPHSDQKDIYEKRPCLNGAGRVRVRAFGKTGVGSFESAYKAHEWWLSVVFPIEGERLFKSSIKESGRSYFGPLIRESLLRARRSRTKVGKESWLNYSNDLRSIEKLVLYGVFLTKYDNRDCRPFKGQVECRIGTTSSKIILRPDKGGLSVFWKGDSGKSYRPQLNFLREKNEYYQHLKLFIGPVTPGPSDKRRFEVDLFFQSCN